MANKIEIHSSGNKTIVLLDGKEISNIVHLEMEIKALETPKVMLTLLADEVIVSGDADITHGTEH